MSRSPDPIDLHVAARLRMRRMMRGVSQEALAARIGVTFQQIQKYEKGHNRIGASRLFQLASALEAPMDYFFEGLPDTANREQAHENADAAATAMLSTAEGVQMHLAFSRIRNAATRRRVIDLLATIVQGEASEAG
jgi:transcriptional regulator with XRE-family HTH domain